MNSSGSSSGRRLALVERTPLFPVPGNAISNEHVFLYPDNLGERAWFVATMSKKVMGHTDVPEVLRQLLRQAAKAAKAAIRPRYLLLDRGFCSVAVRVDIEGAVCFVLHGDDLLYRVGGFVTELYLTHFRGIPISFLL